MTREVMMRLGLMTVLLVAASSASVPAQPKPYQPSDAYRQCMRQGDAAQGSATAVDLCVQKEQAVQQERLGDSFDAAFDALTGWDQVRLFNDQTEWREGLDERCALATSGRTEGGTSSRAYNMCRAEEMANRAEILDEYEPE